MKGDEEIFKSLIDKIKGDYQLMPASRDVLQLNGFSVLEKGDGFKVSYCWELQSGLYLFSLYNSYRLHNIDPAAQKPRFKSFKYLYCFLTLSTDLPDTIVRPNTLGEKIANLIIHSHTRIPHNSKFNSRYLVESTAADLLISKLTEELLLHIENFEELYLEIRDRKCLLLHLRPANYDDTVQLIEISKRLLAI
jgi:hypothetical protein